MDKRIKLIVADVDGTLIEGGVITSYPAELKELIKKARYDGTCFSMASGRDYEFMENLRRHLTDSESLFDMEAVLYEDICLAFRDGKRHVLGGLNQDTLEFIEKIEIQNPSYFGGLVPLPGNKFTIRTSRVTEEFARGEKMEGKIRDKLEERYKLICSLFEDLKQNPSYSSLIENLAIRISKDGIDFVDKDAHKGVAFEKYLNILKERGIELNQILTIGDALNDEEILRTTLSSGGFVGYVGVEKDLELRLKQIKSGALIVPEIKGPLGTLEVIKYLS